METGSVSGKGDGPSVVVAELGSMNSAEIRGDGPSAVEAPEEPSGIR